VPADAQATILTLWSLERQAIRRQLTAAQVKKAWAKAVKNPLTGQPWTEDEARDALVARGYTVNDALTFLHT